MVEFICQLSGLASVGGDHSRDIAGPASLTINDGVISGNQATYRKAEIMVWDKVQLLHSRDTM